MHRLIIGGTNGLGLELARGYRDRGDEVTVTGRRKLEEEGIEAIQLDLSEDDLSKRLGELTMQLPEVHTLVYAAGFAEDGHITDSSDEQIEAMLDVGARGLIYSVRHLLEAQGQLDELITITSTSQWTPREREPVYNFVKAGSGLFTEALSKDKRVGKAMVFGAAGMDTPFWREMPDKDLSGYNDPAEVAAELLRLMEADFTYQFVKVGRNPLSIEIAQTDD